MKTILAMVFMMSAMCAFFTAPYAEAAGLGRGKIAEAAEATAENYIQTPYNLGAYHTMSPAMT